MNRQMTTNIILGCVILLLIGYIGYLKFKSVEETNIALAYRQGLVDAQAALNNQIIQSLNTNGYVTMTFLDDKNRSQSVTLAPVQPKNKALSTP